MAEVIWQKSIQALVVGAEQWLMRATYIGESKRGWDAELEEWQIGGVGLWGERNREKGVWHLIDYPTPPQPLWRTACRLYVLKSKPWQMKNTLIHCSQDAHLEPKTKTLNSPSWLCRVNRADFHQPDNPFHRPVIFWRNIQKLLNYVLIILMYSDQLNKLTANIPAARTNYSGCPCQPR